MGTSGPTKIHARVVVAILIALTVAAYTASVISGFITEQNKIDSVNLALIALGVLGIVLSLRPDVFDRLKHFEMAGVKLDMLENRLQDIALVLPLLLQEAERKHLINLASGQTAGYNGWQPLRIELRRLRSLKLIRMRGDHRVGEIEDGWIFDLGKYVELTELGERWVRRIREIEERDVPL